MLAYSKLEITERLYQKLTPSFPRPMYLSWYLASRICVILCNLISTTQGRGLVWIKANRRQYANSYWYSYILLFSHDRALFISFSLCVFWIRTLMRYVSSVTPSRSLKISIAFFYIYSSDNRVINKIFAFLKPQGRWRHEVHICSSDGVSLWFTYQLDKQTDIRHFVTREWSEDIGTTCCITNQKLVTMDSCSIDRENHCGAGNYLRRMTSDENPCFLTGCIHPNLPESGL